MKRIFESIGLFSLIVLSFLGTEKLATAIKENDDIMKQIKEVSIQYIDKSIDAKVVDNTIIPGISGSAVNIKKSYKEMKKINSFNNNLLVYERVKPNVSVDGVFNKYIIGGNKNKKQVSLLFLVDNNDNIDRVLSVLGNNKVTFYVDGIWFEDNNKKIMDLISRGHIVGNLGYSNDYSDNGVSWMNTIVTKVGNQKDSYCYNEIDDQFSLNRCALNESYTIRPNIIVESDPLITIKENLSNGSIISMNVNDENIKELPLVIKYINSRGLDIVNIEKLLEE